MFACFGLPSSSTSFVRMSRPENDSHSIQHSARYAHIWEGRDWLADEWETQTGKALAGTRAVEDISANVDVRSGIEDMHCFKLQGICNTPGDDSLGFLDRTACCMLI